MASQYVRPHRQSQWQAFTLRRNFALICLYQNENADLQSGTSHAMNEFLRNPARIRRMLAAALLAATSLAAVAADSDKLPARVQVTWAPTEQLTEVKDNQFNRGWLRPNEWMQQLGDHLRKRADRALPPGQHLDVHIDDINLAGSFEPWHQPGTQDIRILKDIYPPSMKLHYTLSSADGTKIRESDAQLRDNSYLQRAVTNTTDPLRFDKRMIDDWLNREFKSAKKSG
jgi:hypothetical protein